MESSSLVLKLERRLKHMKSMRGTFETHWQEVADYVIPRKNDITTYHHPGEKRNFVVYDDTATQSNNLLAGALQGMLTNPTLEWFELTTGDTEVDDQSDIREFLGRTTRKMHDIINASNFQTQIHEVYLDLGTIGTGNLAMIEDDKSIIRFMSKHISEYYIEEDNRGRVDTVFCEYRWSVRKIVQEFGMDALPKFIAEKFEKKPESEICVVHAVFPKADYSEIDTPHDIASVWYLQKEKYVIAEGGFRKFPFAVPRWTKISGEIYGRSPSMQALPSIKMLNQMQKTTIIGAQKAVNPPLLVNDDGVIQPVNTFPGGLNYVRPGIQGPAIVPLMENTRIDFGIQIIQEHRRQVREAFFVDQLQLRHGPQMTATEVMQRTEEQMRLLGPMLGRQQIELLSPLIDRLFDIMLRRKIINKEDIPLDLSEADLKVQYKSLVARSQRINEAQNILRAIESSAPFIQVDPSVMDNYDGDKAVRRIARLFSVPQEIIRDEEDIQDTRDQRSQAMAAQQQRQVASEEANINAVDAQTATQLNNIT